MLANQLSGSVKETCADTCNSAYNQNIPASGITVQLLAQDSSVVASTTTVADGTFLFSDFPFGNYRVKVISSAGAFVGADNQAAIVEPVASFSNHFYIFPTIRDTDNDGFVGTCDKCAGGSETDANGNGTPDACELQGVVGTTVPPVEPVAALISLLLGSLFSLKLLPMSWLLLLSPMQMETTRSPLPLLVVT